MKVYLHLRRCRETRTADQHAVEGLAEKMTILFLWLLVYLEVDKLWPYGLFHPARRAFSHFSNSQAGRVVGVIG